MRRGALANDRTTWGEYASADDFQRLFASEMVDLFHLAFLLTADAEKAERCLVVTMHRCMAAGDVVKGWLPVWTRNALIRNAIGIVTGIPGSPRSKIARPEPFPSIHAAQRSARDETNESAGILELSDFDRLVYVICTLENYPTRDCAMLLGRSRQEVRDAQHRALAQITAFEREQRSIANAPAPDSCLPCYQHRSDLDDSCGNLLD